MNRNAIAAIVRQLAARLNKLGAKIPEPETLNDAPESILALIEAIIAKMESAQAFDKNVKDVFESAALKHWIKTNATRGDLAEKREIS
jgi:hypothetical protein